MKWTKLKWTVRIKKNQNKKQENWGLFSMNYIPIMILTDCMEKWKQSLLQVKQTVKEAKHALVDFVKDNQEQMLIQVKNWNLLKV